MPRIARVVVPGLPHHVTQRGHRGEQVFFTVTDRESYLAWLAQYATAHGLRVEAWCLMTNHVHLVVVPEHEDSLAATLKPLHLRYAQHVQRTQSVTGRIWHDRFFSCPLDESHYWAAVRYVERNPVRAGLVAEAESYPWSSAAGHCGLRPDPLVKSQAERTDVIGDWSAWLRTGLDDDQMATLRLSTRTGRPAGKAAFVADLEERLGRRLAPQRGGRPRKPAPSD